MVEAELLSRLSGKFSTLTLTLISAELLLLRIMEEVEDLLYLCRVLLLVGGGCSTVVAISADSDFLFNMGELVLLLVVFAPSMRMSEFSRELCRECILELMFLEWDDEVRLVMLFMSELLLVVVVAVVV